MDLSADALLRCPVGCNFLWTIARDRAPLGEALAPVAAFERAAASLDSLNPWADRFERAFELALARGTQVESLAHEVATHPASQWWTEPFDATRQVLLEDPSPSWQERTGRVPGQRWEDYAQRPTDWQCSSTMHGDLSFADIAILRGLGDWRLTQYQRRRAILSDAVSVFGIGSPADWHALCAAVPRTNHAKGGLSSIATLVPDWRRLANEYDGVHFTFAGLLTAPFVCEQSSVGSTMLWSWDAEFTIWMTDAARPGHLLPLNEIPPDLHIGHFWQELWDGLAD